MLKPTKNSWSGKGVSIVSDGWSDLQRRPLLNFMAMTKSGHMLLKVVDCSDEIKDKDFVAKQIRNVIREVGLSNVVQIVTYNALLRIHRRIILFTKNANGLLKLLKMPLL
ncbi:hypothetical protein HN51_055851 [Arachis hypogaea]